MGQSQSTLRKNDTHKDENRTDSTNGEQSHGHLDNRMPPPEESQNEEESENDAAADEMPLEEDTRPSSDEDDRTIDSEVEMGEVANPSETASEWSEIPSRPSSAGLPQPQNAGDTDSPVRTSGDGQPPGDIRRNKKVEVNGINSITTEETLTYYFSNTPRSGGGPCKIVYFDNNRGLSFIVFTDPEAASRVVSRPHMVDGVKLEVNYVWSAGSPLSGQRVIQAEPSRTVSVEDFDMLTTTEDSLINYFENQRRSGGGEVIDITFHCCKGKSPVAFVCFRHPGDAANVISWPHTLNGKTLKVCPHYPVPNMVSVHSLPRWVMAEDLRHFIEAQTDQIVEDVRFGQTNGVALVTFQDSIDLKYIRSALSAKPFLGHQLTVEPVEISQTIEVHNLRRLPSVSEETLTNYFQNTARSGGCAVQHVQISRDRNSALVTFADPQVCATVVSQSHVFHEKELEVFTHYTCVGHIRGSERSFRLHHHVLRAVLVVLIAVFLAAIVKYSGVLTWGGAAIDNNSTVKPPGKTPLYKDPSL